MSKRNPMAKIVSGIYLLRKGRNDEIAPVMKPEDFPHRFIFNGKNFVIETTRNGGLIMKTE